jgi:hypothetical protein
MHLIQAEVCQKVSNIYKKYIDELYNKRRIYKLIQAYHKKIINEQDAISYTEQINEKIAKIISENNLII